MKKLQKTCLCDGFPFPHRWGSSGQKTQCIHREEFLIASALGGRQDWRAKLPTETNSDGSPKAPF